MVNHLNLGSKLKDARLKLNLTQKDVADAVGIKKNTLSNYENGVSSPDLDTLDTLFKLYKMDPDAVFTKVKLTQKYPVYGKISAGGLSVADQFLEGYEYAKTEDDGEYFFLRVDGDCMTGARIHNGDLVLIKCQNYAEDGDIVAALIDGEDATLKRYRKANGHIFLSPENSDYKAHIITHEQIEKDPDYLRILGVLKQLIVKF